MRTKTKEQQEIDERFFDRVCNHPTTPVKFMNQVNWKTDCFEEQMKFIETKLGKEITEKRRSEFQAMFFHGWDSCMKTMKFHNHIKETY